MTSTQRNWLSEEHIAELARVRSIKLLPCPFCGQTVTMIQHEPATRCWYIIHRSGNARICRMLDLAGYAKPDECANDWNDRQGNK